MEEGRVKQYGTVSTGSEETTEEKAKLKFDEVFPNSSFLQTAVSSSEKDPVTALPKEYGWNDVMPILRMVPLANTHAPAAPGKTLRLWEQKTLAQTGLIASTTHPPHKWAILELNPVAPSWAIQADPIGSRMELTHQSLPSLVSKFFLQRGLYFLTKAKTSDISCCKLREEPCFCD